MLRRFYAAPPLGRWCHPTSPAYARTCDQMRKADLNMNDHNLCTGEDLVGTGPGAVPPAKGDASKGEGGEERGRKKRGDGEEEEREAYFARLFFNGTL